MKKILIVGLLSVSMVGCGSNKTVEYKCVSLPLIPDTEIVVYIRAVNDKVTEESFEITSYNVDKNYLDIEWEDMQERMTQTKTPSTVKTLERLDDTSYISVSKTEYTKEYIRFLKDKDVSITDKNGKEVDYAPLDWELSYHRDEWKRICAQQ